VAAPNVLPQLKAGTPLEVRLRPRQRQNARNRPGGSDDSQIDTTTGTVKVRAQFDNADNALFPNQFVNAQLLVKTPHNVVTVPTAAIQPGALGSYVYVINADNRVSVRPVNIGPTDGPMAAVNSGVSVGERVVVDGADRLRDGARVTMPAAPSQAPAADPPSNAQNPQPQNPTPNAQPPKRPSFATSTQIAAANRA
jgi:membrane fusion protein, multidrug efflux system